MSRKLRVTDADGERELLLVGTMTVGRDMSCDISYNDPQLSRHHAEFVVSSDAVIVRDLGSSNGILVNGVKVGEARLQASDVVQIAGLSIRYIDDRAPAAVAPEGDAGDDKTRVHPPPAHQAPPAAVDDDKTRVLPPPVFPAAPKPQIQPAPPAPAAAARPIPGPDAAVAPSVEAERKARTARTSWAGRVLIQIMGLAAAVFVIAAVPMSVFQNRLLDATAMSRAVALVNWLAADAAAALQVDGSAVNAADDVGQQAGVVTALLLTPDGRVMAPASRATETIATIPGIGVPPSEVLRPRSAWNGDLVEVARPVRTKDRPRAAVAWITFRPSPPAEAGGSVILLGAAVFFALLAGLVVATTLRRMTLKALTVLNEDIELAVGGQLQEVGDPLGARPVKELADSVNYLVARLKAGAGDAAGGDTAQRPMGGALTPPKGAQAPPPLRPAKAAAPDTSRKPAPPDGSARIVANSKFRVTEASAGCAEMLGVRPDTLIGAHLVDAIPDQQLVDAVLKCLSALPGGGEEKSVVSPAGRPYRVAVSVSRAAKDQPITIVLSPIE